MLMWNAHAWNYTEPIVLAALGEAQRIAMQALNTSAGDTHEFAHLYPHTLVGCYHIRLDDNRHIFGEHETRSARAACLPGSHHWSKVASAEAMQQIVTDGIARGCDSFRGIENVFYYRAMPNDCCDTLE